MKKLILFLLLSLSAFQLKAETLDYPKAKVSFEDFKNLVSAVEPVRKERLVDLDKFLKMSKEPGTIIFDSRSDNRFERIHIKGAKHLSFTDFTQTNLKNLIPDPNTRILIYCNNNFEGDQVDFATKSAMPAKDSNTIVSQVMLNQKPLMMALNIPTYINLYGYGYHNVYELDELVDVNDPRIEFEGSIVKNKVR